MMFVADQVAYSRQRAGRDAGVPMATALADFVNVALLFGSMGAITWAIRGTGGWGGMDGTLVPGLTWGLLWFYVCWRNGIDARGIPWWLGWGIALGGSLGYGQYVSWIQGHFESPKGPIPIAPWIGHAWFVITGTAWAAPGGAVLGWALSGPTTRSRWGARLILPILVAFICWLLVQARPEFFFPHYASGIYAHVSEGPLDRTVSTNTENITVFAWWLGTLIVAAIQKDRVAFAIDLVLGGGFGVGFDLAALWCLGYTYAPGLTDWWKVWELNAGFYLGVLYAIALHWAIRELDRRYDATGAPIVADTTPGERSNRRRALSLTFTVFVLLMISCFGGSLKLSGILGLYDINAIDQYSWPIPRLLVFAPAILALLVWVFLAVKRILKGQGVLPPALNSSSKLPIYMMDLLMALGLLGAITIWPEKIGAIYAGFLCIAVGAFNRFNHHSAPLPAGPAQTDIK